MKLINLYESDAAYRYSCFDLRLLKANSMGSLNFLKEMVVILRNYPNLFRLSGRSSDPSVLTILLLNFKFYLIFSFKLPQ